MEYHEVQALAAIVLLAHQTQAIAGSQCLSFGGGHPVAGLELTRGREVAAQAVGILDLHLQIVGAGGSCVFHCGWVTQVSTRGAAKPASLATTMR